MARNRFVWRGGPTLVGCRSRRLTGRQTVIESKRTFQTKEVDMALQIAGVAALALALVAVLYLSVCWIVAKRRQAVLHFEVTKSGKAAILLQGLALVIGVALLLIRDLPSGIAMLIFWLLFPTMVIASLGAVIVGGKDLRSLYRAMSAFAVGAGIITLVSVMVWIVLPRFLYG